MNVYRFTFPINDYYGENVFEKHVYFAGSRCPTHEEVVKRLQSLAKDEQRMCDEQIGGPHLFEYKQCLKAIQAIENGKKLPHICGDLIGSNIFCTLPQLKGRQPISVIKIQLEEFENPFKSWFKTQKQWTDLLGKYDVNCVVEMNNIVKKNGVQRKVLWTFDTNKDATEVFEQWKKEN